VSGNQTSGDATAPVRVSGNQVTVIGNGNTNDSAASGDSSTGSPSGQTTGGDTTDGSAANGSGNQTDAQAVAPVHVSDNQVTVIGNGQVADVQPGDNGADVSGAPESGAGGSGGDTTDGTNGTGSGNQTGVGALVPVDASGNQVTVIGNGNQSETCPTQGGSGGTSGADSTDGGNGTIAGHQTDAAATAPLNGTGNHVTVIGDGNSSSSTEGDSTSATGTTTGSGNTTDGSDGNGSGNQTEPVVRAPLDTGDNQVTVIGDGNTSQTAGDQSAPTGSGGSTTDGSGGTGSGNQTAPGVEAPVSTSGNQVTILGDGNAQRDTESNAGDDDSDQPGQSGDTGGDTGGDTQGPAGDTGSDVSGATGPGSGTVSAPQGGSAAGGAAALPQTGVAAGLLLWGAAGLAMLLLGLVLVSSQRRRPLSVEGREVHLA
jgi:LPXTG-motif cell wall-anchored protein